MRRWNDLSTPPPNTAPFGLVGSPLFPKRNFWIRRHLLKDPKTSEGPCPPTRHPLPPTRFPSQARSVYVFVSLGEHSVNASTAETKQSRYSVPLILVPQQSKTPAHPTRHPLPPRASLLKTRSVYVFVSLSEHSVNASTAETKQSRYSVPLIPVPQQSQNPQRTQPDIPCPHAHPFSSPECLRVCEPWRTLRETHQLPKQSKAATAVPLNPRAPTIQNPQRIRKRPL